MQILLADDDQSLRRVIQFKLKKQGYHVVAVEDGVQAIDRLKANRYDLLLADIKMPRVDGLELLEESKRIQPDLKVILITAHATINQAVRAVKLGAFDYLTKPFEDDELFGAINKALAFRQLEVENKALKSQLARQRHVDQVVGISKPFKALMSLVDKIAGTDVTLLLTGESGTGKEIIARTVHYKSLRAEKEFIAVNCAAIPRELIESELFGHVKGAFTGAVRDKKGKFELADGGTLLLDEIGELSIDLQAKLLRVIQERVVEPVGAEKLREVDVRLISATNIDLKERIRAGRFREDLYYRLNVIPISIPNLRERKADIPILVKEFLRKFGKKEGITVSPDLLAALTEYHWPGNIRELENLIERMVILRQTDELGLEDLPTDFGEAIAQSAAGLPSGPNGHLTFHESEKKLIVDALNSCGWNRTRAAKYLNIPRHVLIYRIKKYSIYENQLSEG